MYWTAVICYTEPNVISLGQWCMPTILTLNCLHFPQLWQLASFHLPFSPPQAPSYIRTNTYIQVQRWTETYTQQRHTAKTHSKDTQQRHTAKTHSKDTQQRHTAKTHRHTVCAVCAVTILCTSIHSYKLLADYAEPCPAPVPRQHWAAEKQTWKLSSSFSPAPSPTHVTSARKQPSSPDIMVGRAACACAPHPFLLCLEHDDGWVRWRTLLIPTNTSK